MSDNPSKIAFGITSKCEDNSHIFMTDIDKDNINIDIISRVLDKIIDEYKLSNIYIVESSNGYNAFSLDKLPLKLIYSINHCFPNIIDQQYNELQFNKRGFYTLRIGLDKHVVDIRPSPHAIFCRSNAHRIFFNSVFELHIDKYHIFDDYEIVKIIRFLNSKHGVDLDE